MKIQTGAILAATLLATLAPSSALAQDTLDATEPVMVDTDTTRDDGDDFPWGLLGLLGLAGLLGRKRDHDVHVNRTDTNRTDTTNRM